MREFGVRFVRSARREIERLDAAFVARVFSRIEARAAEPRPSGFEARIVTTFDDMTDRVAAPPVAAL